MRDELNRSLVVGGVQISEAVDKVEDVVASWGCDQYTHITRPMHVSSQHEGQVIHLETIFSKPTQDRPVPIAVVCVFFDFYTSSGDLTYTFEQECVKHEVGGQCLASGKYEMWLDRIIGDKLQVRQLHDLATPFEETRLAPPPLPSEHPSEDEREPETQGDTGEELPAPSAAMRAASAPEACVCGNTFAPDAIFCRLCGTKRPEVTKMPLSVLLANIFDAADEEDEFELTHKEVADLLYATPLGLQEWDIKLLLTTASELETGKIEYKPFVQAAPEIIEALLKRRAAYIARNQNSTEATLEAIDLCYGEEIEEVNRAAKEAFTAQDPSGKNTLSRHEFRCCLLAKKERLSSQEVQMLMQMCKEDDFGQVSYDDFPWLLQSLRIDALHNALVETDIAALRIHMILLLRRAGWDGMEVVMTIWECRKVLLSADQLALSRMQIHLILSIVHPNGFGEVDVEYFIRVCCTVVPSMFDTAVFMEKAGTIAKDKADALAKQELEEMQGLSGKNVRRVDDDGDQEDEKKDAPDKDAVEKALIQVGNQIDDKHRQQPTLEVGKFLEAMQHEHVQQQQLSEAELRGFIAEAEVDEKGEILYQDHIKTWVPIVFELRKSRIYDAILSKDWGANAIHLADLSMYEQDFPLRRRESFKDRPSHLEGRLSSKGISSRRRSERRQTCSSKGPAAYESEGIKRASARTGTVDRDGPSDLTKKLQKMSQNNDAESDGAGSAKGSQRGGKRKGGRNVSKQRN